MDPESRQALLQLQLWNMEEKEADRQHLTSYACPCKKCMGANSFIKENHLETSSTIQAGSRDQEINPRMFGGHH